MSREDSLLGEEMARNYLGTSTASGTDSVTRDKTSEQLTSGETQTQSVASC